MAPTHTTSNRTVATASAGGAVERVSTKDIGCSGELWARVVKLESSERTTGRGTQLLIPIASPRTATPKRFMPS